MTEIARTVSSAFDHLHSREAPRNLSSAKTTISL